MERNERRLLGGKVYQTRGGGEFLCLEVRGEDAWLKSIRSGWKFYAHGVTVYPDGRIDWDFSAQGSFDRGKTSREHELKTETGYFGDVLSGRKTFEVRRKDRDYREGDLLILAEVDSSGRYTGRRLLTGVGYILDDSRYCLPGYVILGLKIPVK